MRTLRSTIAALRRHGDSLPEPYCDCYDANPPSGSPWPAGLPRSPLLQDFYAACDGGRLGAFSFLSLDELADETESTADWMQSTGCDAMPVKGHWLVFGNHDFGLTLIWDADRDAVLLYDSDGGDLYDADDTTLAYDGSGPAATGHLTLGQFFERLVNPNIDSRDESTRLWATALQHLDQLG